LGIIYRRPQLRDMPDVANVIQSAVDHLGGRHGFAPRAQPSASLSLNPFYEFSLRKEPDGFWVATDNNEIVGVAISWIRGSFWYLSHLFVSPAYQGHDIGRNLLDKALNYGNEMKITNRALITFAYNPISIALYIRYGMCPREFLLKMEGSSTEALVPSVQEHLDHEKVEPCENTIRSLSQVDQQALGFTRNKHHEFLLSVHGVTCYLFRKHRNAEGYAYIWSNGGVGPLAVVSPVSFRSVMNEALKFAATRGTPSVSLLLSGSNVQALSAALEHKMRIDTPLVLMSSKRFGNWTNYLFHSPGLM
jgi:ribosomal protein S18 acetylase RimI-like enzyme